MPVKALTNKTLEALKPNAKRYEVHDLLCPGMSVRVSAQGQKVFSVKFRYGLNQKRMKLGVYPRITLATAREKAMDILRQVDEGIDPTKRRRTPNMKVEAVCGEFIRLHAQARNKSWREAERILVREFVGTFGQRDIREIKRFDVLEIMDAAVARGSTYQANRILSNIRKLFNWCVERGIVEISPINGLKAPTKEESRDRVLEDDEIVRLLRACRNDVYPFRQFVPILLATAQRRGELAEMRWSEVDLTAKQWVIPADRSKNGKPHVVPLSPYALDVLNEVPRFLDCDYVFTTTRNSPVSGFSKMLRRLSEGSQTSDWRLHDLRRTAASGMARAGVAPHVVEKVLNHISGTISGVAAVYNRYAYDAEKREALDDWGRVLEQLGKHE
ncbi:tyrosine-type recombinase/integrase [Allosphingosinicella flava]|uniref:Tyrosine-type recombinase/integrase n=1 Tax=Allosphingosinicella flava TaxID=2771430 RepID=A0A7T2GKC1_9SPHN|nr:site-specific integrase [Sphingosinicella flava]QPQ55422.1 tyrosine-type recombinase/integrase [Sphingosinicella flava]